MDGIKSVIRYPDNLELVVYDDGEVDKRMIGHMYRERVDSGIFSDKEYFSCDISFKVYPQDLPNLKDRKFGYQLSLNDILYFEQSGRLYIFSDGKIGYYSNQATYYDRFGRSESNVCETNNDLNFGFIIINGTCTEEIADSIKQNIIKRIAEIELKIEEKYNNNKELYLKESLERAKKDSVFYLPPKEKSSGCYIATSVYGSYDCPQVWTLRRYRDNTLAESWYGRAFIKTYYAVSPTIVKWFGETEWFNKMWRGKLDKMVEKLQSEGYENTPYSDK